MSRKRALLCGINYPGTQFALRGCVNDVNITSEILTRQYGFPTTEKRMLTDASATTTNILERLEWLVDGAQPGDVLFFHYSGHGSQVINVDYASDQEPDGKDEIICPVDLNWRDKMITDDQLKAVFDKVPAGVNLTVFMDCCHSGTILDQGHQYMPLGVATRMIMDPDSPVRVRNLPMPDDIANRGIGLDLQVRPRQFLQNKPGGVDGTGLLISGCQSQQTSADSYFMNKYMGAATYFMTEILKQVNYKITYKDLIDRMNNGLAQYNFTQRPELDGSPELYNEMFLQPFTSKLAGGRDVQP